MTTTRAARIFLSLPLVLATAACAGLRPARHEVTPAEYAVYRAVLDGELLPAAKEQLVVTDRAGIPPASHQNTHAADVLHSGASGAVIRDFRARNQASARLHAAAFGTRLPVTVVRPGWVDAPFRSGGDGWAQFYTDHSGSSGVIQLSRVGFSPDGTEAVLTVDHRCGFRCGAGYVARLRWREGRWQVTNARPRWTACVVGEPPEGSPSAERQCCAGVASHCTPGEWSGGAGGR